MGERSELFVLNDASPTVYAKTCEIRGEIPALMDYLGQMAGRHSTFRITNTDGGVAIIFGGPPYYSTEGMLRRATPSDSSNG